MNTTDARIRALRKCHVGHDLAYKHRKRGVIILTFTDTGYSSASYGMTRKDCDAMKRLSNSIAQEIEAGGLYVWND